MSVHRTDARVMDRASFATRVVKEAGTTLVVPAVEGPSTPGPAQRRPIFYNPSSALSRDLSLLALKAYASGVERPILVADPLTGCGARALRYAKEGPEDTHVAANDLNREAVALAREAATLNHVEGRVSFSCKDVRVFLLEHATSGQPFDYVDIDPFGSPAPFLQPAASALRRGGFLALTATDSATLSGLYPRTCIERYWAKPLRTEYHHEVAARILLGFAARTLAAQGLATRPLSTYQLGYALRAHLQVTHPAARGDATAEIGYLYHCFHCLTRELRPGALPNGSLECEGCGRRLTVAGPLWTGHLFDPSFSAAMLQVAACTPLAARKEAFRLLAACSQEARAPHTYFIPAKLGAKASRPLPTRERLASTLRRRGYSFTDTHFEASGFRTDAPAEAVLDAITA